MSAPGFLSFPALAWINSIYSQHSMGMEATCSERTFPLAWGMCTRNTARTRVFFRPMSVSPFRNSMSEFLSFRIPAQSMLKGNQQIYFTKQLAKPPKRTCLYILVHRACLLTLNYLKLFLSLKSLNMAGSFQTIYLIKSQEA